MRDGFIFYESFRKAMKGLPAETQLLLYNAIADYALYDTEPDFDGDGIALGFFTLIRPQLDANIRKRENGARGGRPKTETESEPSDNRTETGGKPNENQSVTEEEPTANQEGTEVEPNAKEKANGNANAKAKENVKASCADKPRRFTRPTVKEIGEYCRERGNSVDPQRFFDFYEAKGWRIGNQPMKDWKAAVRTWERRAAAPGNPSNSPPEQRIVRNGRVRIAQHDYTEEDLSRLIVDLDAPLPEELSNAGKEAPDAARGSGTGGAF